MIENCQVGTTIFTGMCSLHERYIQQAENPKPKKQVCVQRHSLLGGSILYHLGPGIYVLYTYVFIYIYLLEDVKHMIYVYIMFVYLYLI